MNDYDMNKDTIIENNSNEPQNHQNLNIKDEYNSHFNQHLTKVESQNDNLEYDHNIHEHLNIIDDLNELYPQELK